MKKFYILLIALFMVNGAMAQWVPQNSGTTKNLSSVYFTDANTGYAVGDSGTILKTTDGVNWVAQNSGTNISLHSVYFLDLMTGYCVGDSGVIIKTINGGSNWVVLSSGTTMKLNSIYFTDTNTGHIVGFETILKTIDGGTNWGIWSNGTNLFLNSVYFTDANTGYAVGHKYGGYWVDVATIYKTIDGGIDWAVVLEMQQEGTNFNSVFFTDANTGYVLGGFWGFWWAVLFYKTIDGSNWAQLSIPGNGKCLFSVYFTNTDTGYVVGESGSIFKTTDGGINWLTQNSGTYANLHSVHFPSVDTGYAVGDSGTILKTTDGGWYVGLTDLLSKSNALMIYPNPTSTAITIETQIKGSLFILNLSGKELLQQKITEQTTTIDVSGLKSGVYIIRLTSDRTVLVGKFVKQ